jgi:hypothetical protein
MTCDITTQHTSSYEVVMLHPDQGSREAAPSSDKGAPSNITIHNDKEGNKGGKKRRK